MPAADVRQEWLSLNQPTNILNGHVTKDEHTEHL